jgi:hypothetical protein
MPIQGVLTKMSQEKDASRWQDAPLLLIHRRPGQNVLTPSEHLFFQPEFHPPVAERFALLYFSSANHSIFESRTLWKSAIALSNLNEGLVLPVSTLCRYASSQP